MIPDCNILKTGQLSSMDRLSDLPDFIIYHIFSYLGTKEAYRTSVLSKRWTQISATNPVLEFHHYKFSKENASRLLEYIDTRMQKYSKENLRTTTFTLKFPATDLVLACKVDEWLEIAVRNKVVKFNFIGPANYKVPHIPFSAKSLKRLDCSKLEIPYYEAVDLVSLESLDLSGVIIEQRMLCHIVSSCPLLRVLRLSYCYGFSSFVIPRHSKLEILDIAETLPTDGRVILETSSLKDFQYIPKHSLDGIPWPILSKGGSLRNLCSIMITSVDITDSVLAKLLPELALLEELEFWGCHMLTSIRTSNTHLKEICLHDCYNLLDVVIDAPSLKKFKFDGEIDPSLSITISSQAKCSIYFYTMPNYFDTDGFFKLKKLLTGLKSCNVLKLLLNEGFEYIFNDIKFDEEECGNADLGPPCDIRELKLDLSCWELSSSSFSAFVNGLFWACHPCIIYLRVDSRHRNLTVEPLLSKLKNMVKCREHPLKWIEVEGINNGSATRTLDLQLRLYWQRIPVSQSGVDGAASLQVSCTPAVRH